ncbi:glycosyltransferase [Candidatus Woesearchaeota archaeon]|nr:glycosyltransferase [Candidatus Woesearchaeota archaeon]MBW3016483.1 glycosyltransferase [Candidatus Woesearchaeota archaeon]
MLQYMLWGISFITLWLTIVWLNFLYAPVKRANVISTITIGIPVYSKNNDKDAIRTIKSIFASGYPKELLDVIAVDDGSEDNTLSKLKKFKKQHPELPLRVYHKENGGKASALNVALKKAKGEFFAVVDADSKISKDSITISLSNYTSKKVGAVISRIKVEKAENFLERLQRVEYIMSSMVRKIMSNFGTLSMTPGVLSLYRTKTLKKIGGFTKDRNNLTEDLEIAMRLKYKGYDVVMEPESITYTKVPETLADLWRQRIRWTRGYIINHWKYKSMFFSNKHGLFGVFQLPVNVLAILLLIANISIISYDGIDRLINFSFRSMTIPGYFLDRITSLPTLNEFILARNVQVYLPVILVFILGAYLIYFAHRLFKERLSNQLTPLFSYVVLMPYFSTLNWVSSIYHELARTKRKW